MAFRPNSDTYFPSLSSPTSTQFTEQGDRFIPTRSLMNLQMAQFSLIRTKKQSSDAELDLQEIPTAKEEYLRRVEENLSLDSEGKPFKMLAFKGSPKHYRGRLHILDEMMQEEQEQSNGIQSFRRLPKAPERILDAPNIVDNYYLNLMDWGPNNILAVALGPELYLLNVGSGVAQKLMETDASDSYIASVAFSGDGRTLAVGLSSFKLQLWDVPSLHQVRSLEGHEARVGSLSWNGHLLTSGSHDTLIINHDVRSGSSPSSCLRGHKGEVCGLRWSSNGNLLASGGDDNLILIWEAMNMGSSKYLHQLDEHQAAVKALAWCPHQSHVLASGGGTADCCIKMWNAKTGQCLCSLDTKAQVCALVWNKHGKEILSGHGFGQKLPLCLWRYPSMSKIGELTGHTSRVLNLSQSPDGVTVVSAGADETLRFWKVFDNPRSTCSRIDDPQSKSLLSIKRFHIR